MRKKLQTSSLRLGIIAGGQLGKMLIQEAAKWAIETYVLDPDPDCPAAKVATGYVQGDWSDYETVYRFGKSVDLLTFEFEHVNIDAVRKLGGEGVQIAPDPDTLAIIQDKGMQKLFYQTHRLPTSPFRIYEDADAIRKAIDAGELTYPFVQKLRKGGYDGRGVVVIESTQDELLKGPSVVEEKVAIKKELAVIVARNASGDVRAYECVEMEFDHQSNLVKRIVSPAQIDEHTAVHAQEIAILLAKRLELKGILAVEFFLTTAGELLINEAAPRPHNSGHHTIEGNYTSQYEQHLRAILDLPLGSTRIKSPTVMLNLLGEVGHEGQVYFEGLERALQMEGVKVHLYGKHVTKAFRKMGHVTLLGQTLQEALEKANKAQDIIKVKAWQ